MSLSRLSTRRCPMNNTSTRTFFRLLFAPRMVNMGAGIPLGRLPVRLPSPVVAVTAPVQFLERRPAKNARHLQHLSALQSQAHRQEHYLFCVLGAFVDRRGSSIREIRWHGLSAFAAAQKSFHVRERYSWPARANRGSRFGAKVLAHLEDARNSRLACRPYSSKRTTNGVASILPVGHAKLDCRCGVLLLRASPLPRWHREENQARHSRNWRAFVLRTKQGPAATVQAVYSGETLAAAIQRGTTRDIVPRPGVAALCPTVRVKRGSFSVRRTILKPDYQQPRCRQSKTASGSRCRCRFAARFYWGKLGSTTAGLATESETNNCHEGARQESPSLIPGKNGAGVSFFRFKPVKGPYEPWYCGIVESETERVLEKWWECPHCKNEPTCEETKSGGKCYSGCGHP